MKIRSIRIKNFQAHEDLQIELDPRITTIKGPTDVGKSSIIRAVRWVCLNQTPGDCIREGAVKASVAIETLKHVIIRKRSDSSNAYVLDDDVFKSFKSDVPEPIQAVLQISELNFQAQHDAPLWFDETAGEVSRQLNAVIDLGVIDTTLSGVAYEVRRSQERVSICEERLEEAVKVVDSLQTTRDRIRDFYDLERKWERLSKVTEKHERLLQLAKDISQCGAKRAKEKAEDLENLYALARKLRAATMSFNLLEEVLQDIESNRIAAPPDFSPVEKAHEEAVKASDRYHRLYELIDDHEVAQNTLSVRTDEAKGLEAMLHEKTKGTICPLCNQVIQ